VPLRTVLAAISRLRRQRRLLAVPGDRLRCRLRARWPPTAGLWPRRRSSSYLLSVQMALCASMTTLTILPISPVWLQLGRGGAFHSP